MHLIITISFPDVNIFLFISLLYCDTDWIFTLICAHFAYTIDNWAKKKN